jgi:hypothetical protein
LLLEASTRAAGVLQFAGAARSSFMNQAEVRLVSDMGQSAELKPAAWSLEAGDALRG